ncbi:CopG family ribbon-helix-helix protein [Haloterrigena turkmenica]|uniref:CopG family ribbon-helix-helix protein n=1 Tax=Haloterrigena turkmenica TaxID=62320 RepID=UPI0011D0414A
MREIGIQVPEGLVEQLDEFQETRGYVSRSEAGRTILREHLRDQGYWPPEE